MSINNYSRADRKKQVIMTIALSEYKKMGDELTSHRIARAIGMKPGRHCNQLLAEMVSENMLECREIPAVPGKYAHYMYRLSSKDHKIYPTKSREIQVKKNGKQVGQLELF